MVHSSPQFTPLFPFPRAFRLLHANPDAPLIAIHRGRVYAEHDGLSMGPGPFVSALEVASQRLAEVVGKPSAEFFAGAIAGLGLQAPSQAVMIGDDVNDDVRGAKVAGLAGVLVRTGKYRAGDERSGDGVLPDAVVDDFAAAVEWLLREEESG